MASQMSSINSLQPEIIEEILAMLGSMSFESLFEAKRSTKMFNDAAEANIIYKKVSLKKILVSKWPVRQEVADFMERCKDCGNPEALFRKGVVDFFSYCQHLEGLLALGKAAREGHGEAQYILSIIVIFSGDERKEKGMKMLSGMRKAEGTVGRLKEIRANVGAILSQIWINSPIKSVERPTCCATPYQHKWRNGFDYMDREIPCDACHCDREVEFVYGLFPRS